VDVSSLLFGHSKALYSTWIFYKPDHLLIDCGEGVATTLGNGSFAIERILLTHGHIDHISGLPSLLWSRAAGMGDTEKPLEIYYPRDDLFIADMQLYLERTKARLPFELHWIPLDDGASFDLGSTLGGEQGSKARGTRRVKTFATRHIPGRLTIGYKIVETRRRLKAEYSSLSQEEIRDKARANPAGARDLSEEYEATLAAFGGDGLPLDPEVVSGSELLLHEATIIDAAERKHQLHSTLEEAVQVAAKVRPKALVLYHVSGRYRAADITDAACRSSTRHATDFPIWCLFRDRLWNVVKPN
jgi:ribonuclease Z